MNQREKTLLFGGLALVVGVLTLLAWLEPDDRQGPTPQPQSGRSTNNPISPQAKFALNISQSRRLMMPKKPRNIFSPLQDLNSPRLAKTSVSPQNVLPKQLPPIPTDVLTDANTDTTSLRPFIPPLPTGPSPVELATRQAEQDMKQYKFLGYLEKEGVQQIFLSNDRTIYIVKQDEILERDIKIKSIDATKVVLARHIKQAGTTVEVTLSLTKDRQDIL